MTTFRKDDVSGRSGHDVASDVVERLRQGDHECYKKVFYKYHKSIKGFIEALTKSEEVANDITQEVFLALWERRETLEPEKGIVRFLFMLAKQAFVHHYRRSEVRSSHAKSVSELWSDIGGVQGDQLLEAEELRLLIDITVSQMPKMRRSVFEMSRHQGLGIDEIASKLNISKESVSSHLYNALRDLKNMMTLIVAIIALCG